MTFPKFAEGNAKTRITFTNPNSGEYCFYDVHATVTGTEVLEEIIIEAPVRQSARYMISADNPLPKDAIITMGAIIKGETPHFDIISQSISDSILAANTRGKIPILFGVLTTNNMDQAKERASYKGKELALSALSVLDIVFDG